MKIPSLVPRKAEIHAETQRLIRETSLSLQELKVATSASHAALEAKVDRVLAMFGESGTVDSLFGITFNRIDEALRTSIHRADVAEINVGYKLDQLLSPDRNQEQIRSIEKGLSEIVGKEIDRLDLYLNHHIARVLEEHRVLNAALKQIEAGVQDLSAADANRPDPIDKALVETQLRLLVEKAQAEKPDDIMSIRTHSLVGRLEAVVEAIPGLLSDDNTERLRFLAEKAQDQESRMQAALDLGRQADERLQFLIAAAQKIESSRRPYPPLPLSDAEFLIIPSTDHDFVVPTAEMGLCAALARYNIEQVEPGVKRAILDHVKPGQLVVDAGANIGVHTMTLASQVGSTGRVIAFEPTPRICTALQKTSTINGVAGRVEVIEAALSDSVGECDFYVADHSPSNSLFALEPVQSREVHRVRIHTLDDVVPPGTAVHFIKMDVEGAEPKVWRGAKRVISESPDLKIVLEWSASHFRRSGENAARLLSEIRAAGFEAFLIGLNGPETNPLKAADAESLEGGNVFLTRPGCQPSRVETDGLVSSRPSLSVAVYGACHAPALERVLKEQPSTADRIVFRKTPACYEITEEEFASLRDDLSKLDLLIYQPISANHRGPEMATARLIEALPPSTRTVSFQYFHLEIYWPFMTERVLDLPPPPFEYPDYHLAAMVARGLPDDEIADRLENETCFAPYAEQALDQAIANLQERENRVLPGETPLDVRITDFVRNNFRSHCLAYTYNHPSRFVFDRIVDGVLDRAPNVAEIVKRRETYDSDPLTANRFPIPQFVRKAYGITFDEGRDYAFRGAELSREEYIARNREHYGQLDSDTIHKAIACLAPGRPWFKELLDLR